MADPITAAALAAGAVTALTSEAGKTAGKALVEGGIRLGGWLKEKLSPSGQAALAKVEARPQDARLHGALEVEIEEVLTAQPALMAELQALLAQAGADVGDQTATVSGDNNLTIQQRGGGTIRIGG